MIDGDLIRTYAYPKCPSLLQKKKPKLGEKVIIKFINFGTVRSDAEGCSQQEDGWERLRIHSYCS
jgi:hypothetical protein